MEPDQERDAEISTFLAAIFDRYGYDLRAYMPASIRRRVLGALARSRLGNLSQLRQKVLDEPAFFATVLEDLTVRVSEMFRDPSFYQAFRARVVPLLRTYPRLNIWHSGCATGEEVYSSAILLTEEGLYDRTQIYATDLSPQALEQAKAGVYPVDRLPTFTANYVQSGANGDFEKYVTVAYDRIALRESLRRKILFFQHDLVSDQVFGEMHVIFCRNVLIYFGSDLRQRVLGKFLQSVCPGGFLCLGSAERLRDSGGREAIESNELGAAADFGAFVPEERIYRQLPDVNI